MPDIQDHTQAHIEQEEKIPIVEAETTGERIEEEIDREKNNASVKSVGFTEPTEENTTGNLLPHVNIPESRPSLESVSCLHPTK